MEIIQWIILIFVVLLMGVIGYDLIYNVMHRERIRQRYWDEQEEILNRSGEKQEIHATVSDMICYAKTIALQNHKQSKAVKCFVISFKNGNGECFSFTVPEETYDSFEIGLSGILTIIDGEFYGFSPDGI